MGRYITAEDADRAEEMFERLVGYQFAAAEYEEEHIFRKEFGHQIKLKTVPLKILSCMGYLEYEELKYKGWCDIHLNTVTIHGSVLDIPPSIFGVPYKKVKVRFTAGETDIPNDIKDVVTEISQQLSSPNVNSWNIPLSEKSMITISKYRRGRGQI